MALRGFVPNFADHTSLKERMAPRHFVPPRTFVIDIGVRGELANVRKTISDFDMDAVAAIMDKQVLNDRVVENWKEKATSRQTVVFCSTVAHAVHVRDAFRDAGVTAAMIDGNMKDGERRGVLRSEEHTPELQSLMRI